MHWPQSTHTNSAAAATIMDIFHSLFKRGFSLLSASGDDDSSTSQPAKRQRVETNSVDVDLLRTTVEGYIKHAHPEQAHSLNLLLAEINDPSSFNI